MKYSSIFIRVALLALGQSLDCHSASEVSLVDMGKSVNVKPQQSTARQKPCAYFLGYTVYPWGNSRWMCLIKSARESLNQSAFMQLACAYFFNCWTSRWVLGVIFNDDIWYYFRIKDWICYFGSPSHEVCICSSWEEFLATFQDTFDFDIISNAKLT